MVLVSKYIRIIHELKALCVDDDSGMRQSMEHRKVRTLRTMKVWVPKGFVAPT